MQDKIIQLRSGRLGKLKAGHPWIYKAHLRKVSTSVAPGDIVLVMNADSKFLGRGYYNPKSAISVRILTFKDEPIDQEFFHNKIREAFARRKLLSTKTNAYRVIFSEADGLPGLIADRYADTIVFHILTLGMEGLKNFIVKSIKEVLSPKYIYEKSQSPFRKIEGLKDLKRWWGEKGETPIEIFEGKTKFLVDVENGHKTGFYLDQRRSRMAMEGISKGKTVLDLFCYTGGFSISAAVFGAKRILGIDIKEKWLGQAHKNAALNNVSDKVEFIREDAFTTLKNICDKGERFDIIVIDPPSFLKSKHSIKSASKGYAELNLMAMKTLKEGGILATFSCSHNMPNELFSKILKDASLEAKKNIQILKRCHQAEDHPIVRTLPETEYLKGYFLRVKTLTS